MKTIKVQLYTNRINFDLTPILTYVHQYNQKHGIELHVDIYNVSVNNYTSVYTQVRPGIWYWVLNGADKLVNISTDHDIHIFAFDQYEWKSPAGSKYPLLSNVPTSSTVPINGKPFINLGFYSPDLIGNEVMFSHELMHAYTEIANASGISAIDQMDTYDQNDNPDSLTGNFSIQWKNINSWINQSAMPTVILKRNSDNGKETLGTLTYGSFTCNTLERPWLNNQHNISCIPKGSYQCKLEPLGTFKNQLFYELQGVPNRTGIFIHPANYVTQLEGCIALGINPSDINHDGQVDVTSSVDTVAKFIKTMGSKSFNLIIS